MLNQGNLLKPVIGNVMVVAEDMNLPRCEYYDVCKLAGTSLKCSYRKSGLDNCFEPTLEYQRNMMKRCAGCGGCE